VGKTLPSQLLTAHYYLPAAEEVDEEGNGGKRSRGRKRKAGAGGGRGAKKKRTFDVVAGFGRADVSQVGNDELSRDAGLWAAPCDLLQIACVAGFLLGCTGVKPACRLF
jgi:hypothetical protein